MSHSRAKKLSSQRRIKRVVMRIPSHYRFQTSLPFRKQIITSSFSLPSSMSSSKSKSYFLVQFLWLSFSLVSTCFVLSMAKYQAGVQQRRKDPIITSTRIKDKLIGSSYRFQAKIYRLRSSKVRFVGVGERHTPTNRHGRLNKLTQLPYHQVFSESIAYIRRNIVF